MGITVKAFALSDQQLSRCIAQPDYVDQLFHSPPGDTDYTHDARAYGEQLAQASSTSARLRKVDGASDPSYVISAADLKAELDKPTALAALLPSDLARDAAREHLGLLLVRFEDW